MSHSAFPHMGPTGQEHRPLARPQTFCKADEYYLSIAPMYKPMSEEQLHSAMRLRGATDATMQDYINKFNQGAESVIARGGVRVIGMKPQPDDPHVYSFAIPNSPYVIRMWDGGMEDYKQFCLDFFRTDILKPVNLPPGYSLCLAQVNINKDTLDSPPAFYPMATNMPGMLIVPLASWEKSMGAQSIDAGAEKWSVPEGACVILLRLGHPDVGFHVPTRHLQIVVPKRGSLLPAQANPREAGALSFIAWQPQAQ